MALSSDRELEEQLLDAGNKLLNPPSSDDDMYNLLDQVEKCLVKVDQSPTPSMQNALSPSLRALIADKLLHHPNADVKVAVASCISEITRITAPEAPYEDHEMKEVFQLIVSSFENLSDESSRSNVKRTSILETVSKVRSCVVMLDLECDTLIVEMFEHFLKAIRDFHPDNVFSSMETIMTLVLEESEDISKELLSPLLASVKNDAAVLPRARKLGERVLQSCAAKVKPYLIQAVKSMGISTDDYSHVVASICEQEASSAVEQNDGHATPDQGQETRLKSTSSEDATQVDKDIATGETPPEHADPTTEKSPKSVVSNDITQTGEEESFPDSNSRNQEDAHHADQLKGTNSMSTTELDNMETEKADEKVDQTTKKTPPSFPKAKDPSDGSCTEGEKEAKESLDTHKSNIKDDANSPCKEEPSIEAVVSSGHEKDKALENESDNVASQSPSEILPEEGHARKAGIPKNVETSSTEEIKSLESEFGNVASPLPSDSLPEEGRARKAGRPKKENPSTKDITSLESESENVASPSPSEILPEEGRGRKAGRPKKEIPSTKDTTSLESKSETAVPPAPSESLPEEGRARKDGRPKKESPSTKDTTPLESESGNAASPSPSESLPEEGRAQKAGRLKKETPSTKDTMPLESESGNAASPSPSERLPEGRARRAGRPKKETPLTKDTKPLESESGNAASPSPSVSLPEEGRTRKAGRPKKKTLLTKGTTPLESESGNAASPLPSHSLPEEGRQRKAGRPKKKEISSIKDTMSSADAISKQASEVTTDSEVKPSKYSGEKLSSGISNEDTNATVVASKKESGAASDSKENASKETAKKVEMSADEEDGSLKHSEDKKKRGRPKAVIEKDVTKSSAKEDSKGTISSSKSDIKSTKNENRAEETPQANSKRKRTPVVEKKSCDKSGEDLVGSKIKVWWPKDRMFYEGVVDYYDSAKKKHKVLYIDGDEETLNLQKQKWQLVACDSEADKGEEAEESSPDASSDVPQKKKAKTISDLSAKQGKLDTASKRGGGGKAKGSATKSGRKSMDADGADGKTKSELLKKPDDESGSKSEVQAPKGGSKSVTLSKAANKTKDDDGDITTPKTSLKSKQETPKTGKGKQGNKSKGKTPKGGRSSGNGNSKVKSSSSKVVESEDAEEASSADSAEAPESKKRKTTTESSGGAQTKTGKKRRRGGRS